MQFDKNFKPDKYDERDIKFTSDIKYTKSDDELPVKIDMREFAREIESQGQTGSCVANATISCLELYLLKNGIDMDLIRLFVYYNIREIYSDDGTVEDTGSYPKDAFNLIRKKGICKSDKWIFDEDKVNDKPSEEAFNAALINKVATYKRIDINKNAMKNVLDAGYPFIIGMFLDDAFMDLKDVDKLADQDYKGADGKKENGHAMNVVGYDDDLGGFIVENSWGNDWGAKGYCLIKYDVMEADCHDAWTCTGFDIQNGLVTNQFNGLMYSNNLINTLRIR